jgi:hypothetical protein
MKEFENTGEKKIRDMTGNIKTFGVPKDYFESLPDEILSKINSLPDFEKSSARNPFTLPEGYFEKLPVTIAERVSKQKRYKLSRILRPRLSIPIVIGMMVLLAGIYYLLKTEKSDSDLNNITADDLKNSSYFYSMDEEVLVDAISSQDLDANDEGIEQYLLDNDVEISQIESQL